MKRFAFGTAAAAIALVAFLNAPGNTQTAGGAPAAKSNCEAKPRQNSTFGSPWKESSSAADA